MLQMLNNKIRLICLDYYVKNTVDFFDVQLCTLAIGY